MVKPATPASLENARIAEPGIARAELVQRVAEILPVLEANAHWSAANRRLHDESVEAMASAGVFRMRVPARYGGYDCDLRTVTDVGMQLGQIDGSAAFTVALWWISTWIVGMFPDQVQDEIFANPDTRICGTLAPTGTATPKNGGIVVNGQWGYNTGAAHSQWKMLSALLPTADGGMEPIMAVVPVKDVEFVDDWHVTSLQGTGSITAVVRDLFIPEERYVRVVPLLFQKYFSERNRDTLSYRSPMVPAISATTVGKIVGLAKGAQAAFMERLPGRGITYTDYTDQAEAPLTHLQVADAALRVDEAEFHSDRLVSMVDEKAIKNEPWTPREHAYARAAVGRVCQLASSAVDTYAMASGASSIFSSVRIQHIQRDLQAITLHGLNLPSTNLELYGRVLCGLPPNTTFISMTAPE